MTPLRHRNAWVWLAVAAMSMALVARAETGMHSARVYSHPVLAFLTGHSNAQPDAATVPSFRGARANRYGAGADTLAAMLPVLFVGLVSPLNLVSPGSLLCIGRAPAVPEMPYSWQRPPPSFL